MLILGIETSCDETGVALYDSDHGLRAHALHTQIAIHREYGGVVPELASRDHIRRITPLLSEVLKQSGAGLASIDAIAYTQGPGLAGALLVGAGFAEALAAVLGCPTVPVHHLEGHLLSPLLSSNPPSFPFVALLVSGGHSQLMRVAGVGDYQMLGQTLDDAAGEAFDKSAKLLGLPYPGGPALAELAERGRSGTIALPRPMLDSGDFSFSFSGLKTAVSLRVKEAVASGVFDDQMRADIALAFQEAVVDVLSKKALAAVDDCGVARLVVAGGVGANRALRRALDNRSARSGIQVFYPEFEFCTDNGAMIALAGALRLQAGLAGRSTGQGSFAVRPRWLLDEVAGVAG